MAKGGQSGKVGLGQQALKRLEEGDVWAARLLAQRAREAPGAVPEEAEAAAEVLARTAFPRAALKVAGLAGTLMLLLILLAAVRG